jgi:hypothetical protein
MLQWMVYIYILSTVLYTTPFGTLTTIGVNKPPLISNSHTNITHMLCN